MNNTTVGELLKRIMEGRSSMGGPGTYTSTDSFGTPSIGPPAIPAAIGPPAIPPAPFGPPSIPAAGPWSTEPMKPVLGGGLFPEIMANPALVAALKNKQATEASQIIPLQKASPINPSEKPIPQEVQDLANREYSNVDEELARNKASNLTSSLAAIAEGMGNVKLTTPGQLLYGNAHQPIVAEGLRGQVENIEDTLTTAEREYLGKMIGREIPKGMTASRLKLLFPNLASFMNAAMMIPYRQQANEIAQQRADSYSKQVESNIELSPQRLGEMRKRTELAKSNQRLREIANDRLSAPAEKTLQTIDIVRGELDLLEKSANSEDLGPLAGRYNQFKARVGVTSSIEAQILSNIKMHTMFLQNALAGVRGAASPELHKLLTGLTPEIYNNPEGFQGIIDAIRKQMDAEEMEVLAIQAKQGRGMVENFLKPEQSLEPSGKYGYEIKRRGMKAGPDMIKVTPDGNTWGEIPSDKWEDFKKKYPSAMRE